MRTLPFGTWHSPVTPEALAAGSVTVAEVRADGPDTYWLEGRPAEGGRVALMRHDGATGAVAEVLGAPWNVRTRVHEYGGGAYAVRDGVVVFSEASTGQIFRLDRDDPEPVALTPADLGFRYGGLTLGDGLVYAAREHHTDQQYPENCLVALDLSGLNPLGGDVLLMGSDFVGQPVLSPDGRRLAVPTWDHPNMPWDETTVTVLDARTGERLHRVHRPEVAVVQPRFDGDRLLVIADPDDWWTVHAASGGELQPVHRVQADLAGPQWVHGLSDWALLGDGRALVRFWVEGSARLAVLDPASGALTELDLPGVLFEDLGVAGGEVTLRRGFADAPSEVTRFRLTGTTVTDVRTLARAGGGGLDAASVSVAEPVTWPNSSGQTVHGFLHRPRLAGHSGPEADRPPVMALLHGGPTSRAEPVLALTTQFWTTRGWAVLVVNHGGSTGFGRAYRERLRGQWGVVDIDDTATGIAALAERGLVDGARAAIRGGSAGGYAVLRALTTTTVFASGACWYGIADLDLLAAGTHKFESRYDQGLIGGPPGSDVYRERSPLHDIGRLHGALLLLHGDEDRAVPVDQAETMADAAAAAGHEVDLVVYPGEGHGFRRAETIIDAWTREVAFHSRALGLR